MRTIASGVVAIVLIGGSLAAHAQSGDPIVRAEIKPLRVVVGQGAVLSVDVLAPNYMPAPPVLPDFQIRNLVTRQTSAVNFVEQHDSGTYAGVRYEFAVVPLEAGAYTVPSQSVAITYAADPPAVRTVSLPTPAMNVEAFIPPEARNLDPFVASNKIAVVQSVDRSSSDLKVGDSITRTITVTAADLPAMLIPPMVFKPVPGFAIYPSQPILRDDVDRRSGSQSGVRTEQAVYLLQKPGEYSLPPISFDWWNIAEKKIEHAQAEKIDVHVAENAAVKSGAGDRQWHWSLVDLARTYWQAVALLLLSAAILAWYSPRLTRLFVAWRVRRQNDYRQSEAFYFARLRRAAAANDARSTYFALLDWLRRFVPLAPAHSIRSLTFAADDPRIDFGVTAIEQNLFGRDVSNVDLQALVSRIAIARRRLLRGNRARHAEHPLPADINPIPVKDEAQAA